jgi:ATP:ADP antiporter, AAA family
MRSNPFTSGSQPTRSRIDRALSLFTDIRDGEGALAVLMLVNIFLLLVCYSVIKTVREPLILLGGGAELRSYAAAGQAVLLIGFVPLYSWLASRVDRTRLLVGVTLFFVACIELFAIAVTHRVPYVGVAFFIWVGIFNISLVAQFWSFANDIYSKDAAGRLFPVIVIGMTAGAPLGSFAAGHLFALGIAPQTILHIAAALLVPSIMFYLWMHRRDSRAVAAREPMSSLHGGFQLVLGNRYLRLVALLVILLNVVNTTGEYLVARMLTNHVGQLALADPAFNKQAFIGAFSGNYQFWVNVVALFLQAFFTSRLLQRRGLAGVLLALPLIALGGYAIVAAGVGFSAVRWIKTAENATDYSVMNTARQLLWVPTSLEEKYKAKQAIDTFFVRAGDVLSAAVVFVGTQRLHLDIQQLAFANIALTIVWLGVAMMILRPERRTSMRVLRPLVPAAAAIALLLVAAPASAQSTREAQLDAQRAEKSQRLSEYKPDALEHRLGKVESALSTFSRDGLYPFVGGVMSGGGIAVGPGYRGRYSDTGTWDVHGAWSIRNFKIADASMQLPELADGKLRVRVAANRLDAPRLAFYGIGADSSTADRQNFSYTSTTFGVAAAVQATRLLEVGSGVDSLQYDTTLSGAALNPSYRRTRLFAEIDSRTDPGYTRRGGLYRVEWSDYRRTNGRGSFQQTEGEVRQYIPLLRENWVIALRALTSLTQNASAGDVPFFLMPSLGGNDTLRGYPSWRFRDRNRLLLSGEYRWTAGSFVDMALFLDAAQVAARASDFGIDRFKKTYGVGLMLHTMTSSVTRIDLARTPDGNSLVFSFSPRF